MGRGGVSARLPADEKEHQASSRARRRGLKGCSLPIHPGGEPVFRDLKVNAACGFRPVRAAAAAGGWLVARNARTQHTTHSLTVLEKRRKALSFHRTRRGPVGGEPDGWPELKSCSTPFARSVDSCIIFYASECNYY